MSRGLDDRRSDAHLIANYRGLMLAFCLDERSVMLLLGCDRAEAVRFQHTARGEFESLRMKLAHARMMGAP